MSAATPSVSPRPTLYSRSQWPWSFNAAHAHTPSSSSPLSISATHPAPSSSSSTNQSSTTVRPSSSSVVHMPVEEPIRQWNFSAFEWSIRNVHALRDYVENTPLVPVGEDDDVAHEVLRESPDMADGRFKLEIVRTSAPAISPSTLNQPDNATKPRLLLCITSLMMDYVHEYDVTMLAAVKVQDDRGGERGARADWVWECWEKDWTFRQDSEVWECTFPSLSTLLENVRIAETDSFVICVQLHNPVGPHYPQHPFVYYVPKDLLDGVEASLDNPNTGDVRFVCVERMPQSSSTPPSPMLASSHSRRSTSEASAYSFTMDAKARKRTIYAHSDILSRRSEYFNTMLTSSFSENANIQLGERKIYEIVVEEADFITIYWLLKYCYANWVLFKEQDDPRNAVEHIGEGWNVRWLHCQPGSSEWDWKPFSKPALHEDTTATSVGSKEEEGSSPSVASSSAGQSILVAEGKQRAGKSNPTSLQASSSATSRSSSRLTNASSSTPRATSKASPRSPTVPKLSSAPPTSRVTQPTYSSYPISPARQGARAQSHSLTDPHLHPTPQPQPASALSIWLVAHRYSMPGLEALAMNHIMTSIQPSLAFPFLLATARWDDLHNLVEDYIVDHWDLVCASEEFDRCCQEVAAGEWGPEGGRTLAALFRRLRSR